MAANDALIIDWIRDAADRVDVDPGVLPPGSDHGVEDDADAITWVPEPVHEVVLVEPEPEPSALVRRPGRLVLVAAVAMLVVGLVGVRLIDDQPTVQPAIGVADYQFGAPRAVPDGAPEPATALPHLAEPPEWFGAVRPAERTGGLRTGSWVSAAIGVGDTTVVGPIAISATDGGLPAWLDDAESVVDGDLAYVSFERSGYRALASTTDPAVIVSGAVSVELLLDVLWSATAVDAEGELAPNLWRLPDGYSVQIQPQVQAPDPVERPTLTNAAGDTAINEVSDWVNPELAAANSGAAYTKVSVGGVPAWTGRSDLFSSISFLVWSPQPGVVFEITSSNPDRSLADLIRLAEATTVLPVDDWHELYG